MPVFQYECPQSHQFEAYVHTRSEPSPPCRKCGVGGSERIWAITKRDAANGYPYKTRNIDPGGRELTVESPSHEAQLCKQYGVVKRDDAGWIETRYEGWDMKRKQQRYKEGSGVGLPGCWV